MMGITHLEVFALVCKIHMTLVFRSYVRLQNAPHWWAGERPSEICVFKQFVHIFSNIHQGDGAEYAASLQSKRWCVPACLWKNENTHFFRRHQYIQYQYGPVKYGYPGIHINPCRCLCIRKWSASGRLVLSQVVSAAKNISRLESWT